MRKILMLMIGGVALTATFVASAVSAQPLDDPPVLLRRNPNPGAHWLRDYDASHPKQRQNQMRNRPQFGSRNFGDGGGNVQFGGDFRRPRNAQFGSGQFRQNGFGMQSGGNFRHRHHHHHGHRHHHRF